MQNKLERNSSVELLRIIAIMGVTILHYNNTNIGGGLKFVHERSINQYYLYFTESLFICAVDLFIIISAFYLSGTKERSIIKIFELLFQLIVFRLLGYLIPLVIHGSAVSIKTLVICILPVNYFVILYSVLYIISPYINVIIDNLSIDNLRRLLIVLFLTFSVWTISVDFFENVYGEPMKGLNSVGLQGSQSGYTIVNFVLLYFIGAYIRRSEIKIKKGRLLVAIGSIVVILTLGSLFEHMIRLKKIITWNYNNPFVIILAVAILLLFLEFDIKNVFINELAKAAFTCFLFHRFFMTNLHIKDYVNKSIWELIIHQIGVAVIMYLLSYLVYRVYKLSMGWLIRLVAPFISKINISLK